jgi:DNA sulfur modification protein DndC
VREDGPHPDMELINDAELLRIREIWSQEPNPAFFLIDPVKILEENSERKIAWPKSDDFGQKHQEYKALKEAASKHNVPSEVLTKMLKVEEEFRYSASRKGLNKKLLSALRSSWSSREEVLSERERRKIVEEEIVTNED